MNDSLLRRLSEGALDVQGRLVAASNATLRCTIEDQVWCVYKPVSGERPLWDFPTGTLTGREVASYEIDRVLGFDLIPPTVWRTQGPAGPGMCQLWVEEDEQARLVDVVAIDAVPDGWLTVLHASDGYGAPVALVHAPDERLQQMAVLDSVLNNGDRKGGHVITDVHRRIWAVDHGVTLSEEPKLRTVLWGWAGEPVPSELLEAVRELRARLSEGLPQVERWLLRHEVQALVERCDELLHTGLFPRPHQDWPAIPWPVF